MREVKEELRQTSSKAWTLLEKYAVLAVVYRDFGYCEPDAQPHKQLPDRLREQAKQKYGTASFNAWLNKFEKELKMKGERSQSLQLQQGLGMAVLMEHRIRIAC